MASQPRPQQADEAGDAPFPRATPQHPVTLLLAGYQDVEDLSESRLGEVGVAEVVLIDEDDERSLREKTVTDGSLPDGAAAAHLVSGRPASSEDVASSQLSSDAPAPPPCSSSSSSSSSAPPGLTPAAGTDKRKRCQCCVLM